jgi:hypothetical protein
MNMDNMEPKAPRIPTVGEKLDNLNDWMPSENPHEGRFPDTDADCAGDCPTCDSK